MDGVCKMKTLIRICLFLAFEVILTSNAMATSEDISINIINDGVYSATVQTDGGAVFSNTYTFTLTDALLNSYSGLSLSLVYTNLDVNSWGYLSGATSSSEGFDSLSLSISTTPSVSSVAVSASESDPEISNINIPSLYTYSSNQVTYTLSSVFSFLTVGNQYTITISGVAAADGGLYTLDMLPTPVPESSVMAYLIVGLMLYGPIVFKRSKICESI